jgi:DNA-directed RNA polymerase subunit L
MNTNLLYSSDIMKVTLIKNESKELVLEFEDMDVTIPDMLANKLTRNNDVLFAGILQEHPQVKKPTLVLKTEKKKAMDVLEKEIDSLEEAFSSFKSDLSKSK